MRVYNAVITFYIHCRFDRFLKVFPQRSQCFNGYHSYSANNWFHLSRLCMVYENVHLRRLMVYSGTFPYEFVCVCYFVNVPWSDIFNLSRTIIFVLLSFSEYVCHVGNRHVSVDTAGFCVACCVLPFLCFFFGESIVRYTDTQVVNNYVDSVWTEHWALWTSGIIHGCVTWAWTSCFLQCNSAGCVLCLLFIVSSLWNIRFAIFVEDDRIRELLLLAFLINIWNVCAYVCLCCLYNFERNFDKRKPVLHFIVGVGATVCSATVILKRANTKISKNVMLFMCLLYVSVRLHILGLIATKSFLRLS
jgi:hypothetical protein